MNLLNISIIMSCNKLCPYCPISVHLVPIDNQFHNTVSTAPYPFDGNNCINNEALLKWVDKYIDPNEFIIEITGGEPALYREIDSLITELNNRNFYGLIKTNGTIPLLKSKNFQRVVSWHTWQDSCPTDYDQILIIRNPKDNWRAKVEYCKQHNIPYGTSLFDDFRTTGVPVNRQLDKIAHFLGITHINNQGQVTACPKRSPDFHKSIWHDTPPTIKTLADGCAHCGIAADVETFLPDWLQEKVMQDFNRRNKYGLQDKQKSAALSA